MKATRSVTELLCPNCGLCCDGTLFRDVELLPGDHPAKLAALGAPLSKGGSPSTRPPGSGAEPGHPTVASAAVGRGATLGKFPQPCFALTAHCRCRIYEDRPERCRHFECALHQQVAAGAVEVWTALGTIRRARAQADLLRKLMRRLGDTDEHLPLSRRFHRLKQRLESEGVEEPAADCFAELSVAMHALQLLLRRDFYPDPTDQAG